MLGLLALANRVAREVATEERETNMELAQESAVEFVIFDLVTSGTRSRWAGVPRTGEILIDGHAVQVSTQNVRGLLDLGTADGNLLSTLVTRVLGADARVANAKIDAARRASDASRRPFATYAEVQAVAKLSNQALACLYPHVTLYSGLLSPVPSLASSGLVNLLRLDPNSEGAVSVLEEPGGIPGSTYRINAMTTSGDLRSQVLSAEVTLTGSIRPSHLMRSWQFLPRRASERPC